ncbi:shikimate dehydrogenase [Halalkalibacterium halodurans]|jgi:shikimate dehydrogenase|uniref:shikimate dehydrogenase n=1 Tax=Halalkalibacterium halodurans TaxID=86665 RepID=UPI002AA98C7B|nr:shikimate dehydrogenase [Halalkalibacterium halodurans]MDY7221851.1 shikimate dehydrogenase [Halalkalibacterium halodurans]MDY7241127.1 shikimate dehydrogenase [Halalkalibacterium halodurans]MED4161203.1 shikimate dehydrogenase [Halalkalibacterium halodurans]
MKKLFGLLGHPVGHSLSPLMHNQMFQLLDFDGYYHAFDVEPSQLEKAVEGARALQMQGFNVTIPHKVTIMDYLDMVDEEAQEIGAVNTVVMKDGQLFGSNTDGQGYLESLMDVVTTPFPTHDVLIIGAGGAARAIGTVLKREKVRSITIANRTLAKAEEFSGVLESSETSCSALSLKEAEQQLERFSVIINTTSVGMSPRVDDMPLSLERLSRETVVSDLIYNPLETKFLREAKQKGAKTVDGLGMFVNQGALAFELWTGLRPDREKMRRCVLEQLGG